MPLNCCNFLTNKYSTLPVGKFTSRYFRTAKLVFLYSFNIIIVIIVVKIVKIVYNIYVKCEGGIYMKITFDTEKLTDLLKDFYTLTKMRSTVFDDNFVEIAQYPETSCDFCAEIKSNPETCARCKRSDISAFNICRKSGTSYTYTCHAGLTEIVSPIKCEGVIIGYMMFGQVVDTNDKEKGWEIVHKKVKDYPVDILSLRDSYYRLRTISPEHIKAAAHILQACAGYIWYSDYLVESGDDLAFRIEQYITRNIANKLTSDLLCNELCISRAMLYQTSRESFGMGIARYIKEKRINLAGRLLLATDYKISTIAEMTGIGDYNYFTKLFKTEMGVTPKEYRKNADAKIKSNNIL